MGGKRPGTKVGSPQWLDRVTKGARRGKARARELRRVRPRDLHYLRHSGTVTPALTPFLDDADLEAFELTVGYEGDPDTFGYKPMSRPRKALLDDCIRAGFIMRGELARYAQDHDSEAGSRALTAIAKRGHISRGPGGGGPDGDSRPKRRSGS